MSESTKESKLIRKNITINDVSNIDTNIISKINTMETLSQRFWDYHVHTRYADIAAIAYEVGMFKLAFTQATYQVFLWMDFTRKTKQYQVSKVIVPLQYTKSSVAVCKVTLQLTIQ